MWKPLTDLSDDLFTIREHAIRVHDMLGIALTSLRTSRIADCLEESIAAHRMIDDLVGVADGAVNIAEQLGAFADRPAPAFG